MGETRRFRPFARPRCPEAAAGAGGAQRFLPQGRVPLRPGPRCFHLPGPANPGADHYGKSRDLQKIDYSNPAACPACPLRPRCTTNVRRVSRLENEAVLDRMAARLKARPELLDRRRETVEHPFGSIKQWMNQGAFLMRGLDNVRGEFSLTALVYNLRRALNIIGVGPMTAAVRDGKQNLHRSHPAAQLAQGRGLCAAKHGRAVTPSAATVSTRSARYPQALTH